MTKGRIDPSEVRIVADPSGTALIIAAATHDNHTGISKSPACTGS